MKEKALLLSRVHVHTRLYLEAARVSNGAHSLSRLKFR